MKRTYEKMENINSDMVYNQLCEYTRIAKYAQYNPEKKRRETWEEQTDRVFKMHKVKYGHLLENDEFMSLLNETKGSILKKNILGSQRALQFGGPPILSKNTRIYNCAATYIDRARVFQEIMFTLLCGVGIGFSVQTHHVEKLPFLLKPDETDTVVYQIPDSIEGWSESVGVLLSSYFYSPDVWTEWYRVQNRQFFDEYYLKYCKKHVIFDYSLIRPKGANISHMGKAPGPDGLRESLEKVRDILDKCCEKDHKRLSPIECYDIIMHLSDAVLSGGIRRSATLCLFSVDDEEMIGAKTGDWYIKNPQRARSNNSALLVRNEISEEKYNNLISSVKQFGEPGLIFADSTETLYNPCVEISLYGYDKDGNSGIQFCNLSEINMGNVKSEEDFLERCRHASIIGTLQAGYTEFGYLDKVTKDIVEREALIGVSMTGMMDSPQFSFDPVLLEKGATVVKDVNKRVAKILGINQASRTTCVKPAGCLKSDSIVVTSKGLLYLDEIGDVNGDQWQQIDKLKVHTQSVGENMVSKFYVNGYKETRIIVTETGNQIESTLNHKFRIYNMKTHTLEWKTTEDLKIGDVIPYSVNSAECINIIDYVKLEKVDNKTGRSFYKKQITMPEYLTEDLGWLLGLYIGDGSNHTYGIRINGNSTTKLSSLEKAQKIIKQLFNWDSKIYEDSRDSENECKRTSLYLSSKQFSNWMVKNNLLKNKSIDIVVPLKIRQSPTSVLNAFIDGYWCADGSNMVDRKNNKKNLRSWCTTSEKMSKQMLHILRYLGFDCSVRLMPPTNSSYGTNMRYWIAEKKGWNGEYNKNRKYQKYYEEFKEYNMSHMTPDIITEIKQSYCETYDIEVPYGAEYTVNSISSHNSTSCILGTSSGIHPCHAQRYFRRVQSNKMEEPLKFFKQYNPSSVTESVWSSGKTDDVITFLCKSKPGALTKKDVTAIGLLEKVKLVQNYWVTAGRNIDLCAQPYLNHNVSNTITMKSHEWDPATKFIYENREHFAGISMLGETGDMDYQQAPFQEVLTHEEITRMYGAGSVFSSGLIVHALDAFDNNLYTACSCLLGFGEKLELPDFDINDSNVSFMSVDKIYKKIRWVSQAKKFALRHFDNNLLNMTYCLKSVDAWKTWCDLKRSSVTTPWEEFYEDDDNTKRSKYVACSGGACEVITF